MPSKIIHALQQRSADVIRLQSALTALPALGPTNDGTGEKEKADYVLAELARMNIAHVECIKAPDTRVPCGYRPSIAAKIIGKSSRTLWILGHLDVVPPGDLALWQGDPWNVRVEGDVLIGRGVEDNQQAIVSTLLLLDEIQKHCTEGCIPALSIGGLFVADEETGHEHGIGYLMEHHTHLFGQDDIFVVPDFGCADGTLLEIAEKHLLWLTFTVEGKQCHGSTPHRGKNAMLAGSALVLALQELHNIFSLRDDVFDPPLSTFTPTKREANVPNINTVPARDVFSLDCRILPQYDLDEIYAQVEKICAHVAERYAVRIHINTEQRSTSAPPTPKDSLVVQLLQEALHAVGGITPRLVGVGGGTMAVHLRKAGLETAVWSKILSNCHEPEEKALISNALFDAQVFAHMAFSPLTR